MRKYAPALVIDVILVIVFAALGRSSHDEGLDLVGLAGTAWPFLGGLTIGWFLTAWLYRDKFDAYAAVPTGLVLWVSTLVGGMLLRALTGQGTAAAFVIVATLFLGAVLIGWRVIARVVTRRRVSTG
ncbi:DUF3054 domain-containing protein [Rhodococcus artemisiae]|uniref:DUF3054 domain-containing protein n=1 Tax=Rhodococcus artemisiae TaxID=714159 RepID=A0ABU7L661_9NOCA|nr:DUF3054 domain-containing protein [Rhodococcus artemisiae]MEE2057024.1 DUF3054 domain-containing protein [Rhodococcus artemisiae]